MPSIHRIRKEILQALEESILPALWRQEMVLGYVDVPLSFPEKITTALVTHSIPRADREKVEFPLQARWPQANLHSTIYPYIGFVYEGVAEERTMVTAAQANMFHQPKGIHAIRWPAPGALLFPPGVPHNDGALSLWRGAAPLKLLWMLWDKDILLHTHINSGMAVPEVSHSLQVHDPTICSLLELFVEELQQARSGEQHVVQGMLLAAMLRLHKRIRPGQSKIANTSRSPLPSPGGSSAQDRGSALCREIAIYIQMHLHEPLSLPVIAQEAGISSVHLNRIFQRTYGMPVMRYVRLQRIAAASKILEVGDENITEIAQLVGFKRANVFSHAFRQETGLTPGQFKRQFKRNKDATVR